MRQTTLICTISSAMLAIAGLSPAFADDSAYVQRNLVSDLPGAEHADGRLINAWGIARSPTGPWWVNAAETGLSIVYDGNGAPAPAASPIVVTVAAPQGATGPAAPTGIVFNGSLDFPAANGRQSLFIFVTEDGTISGWNPNVDATHSVIKVNRSGTAIYKGAALGQIAGRNVLYAADFHSGHVDVFDALFQPVSLPASAFTDPRIPAGYAPFNVQNVDGSIYVTFAKQDADKEDDVAGPGNGYVDQFTPEGVLKMRLQHGPWMNAPWAVVKAPSGFGELSNKILVGNFGSGQIAAFDAREGEFEELMRGRNEKPVQIDGLWGLGFGNGASAGAANVLFFAAGPQDESHGLFGTLTAMGEAEDDHDHNDDREHGKGRTGDR